MKNLIKHILFLLGLPLVVLASQVRAQEQIAVPLTNSGEPGSLHADVIRGSISVSGYGGEEVLISYNGEGKESGRQVTKDGLRRISNNAAGFEVTEDDNKVEISGASPLQSLELQISVPRNFALYLSTVNGTLMVENVNGEMDLSNVNGEVTLRNVGGSALVNTVNGDIKATFTQVSANKPMAFSNLNGDIDVTLPADAEVTAKMKSDWGEVYTDFDMNIQSSSGKKVRTSSNGGTYNISVNNWIMGNINGGGPEYLFKSLRGDIYIRKSN